MVEHDDVNVLALGARVIGPAVAADVVTAFASARFSGAARHARRLGKVLAMEATRVHGAAADVVARGQSMWLDGVEATTLGDGRVAHWIGDCAVTGATTTLEGLISALATGAYRERLADLHADAVTDPEDLALALLLGDAVAAADLVHGVYAATAGVDGYTSVDLPSALVDDVEATVELARRMHTASAVPNLMVKVPATRAGHAALRRLVAGGIPVHATLVFSAEQYRAAAEAFMDGIELRLRADEDPDIASLVSMPVAPWDEATAERLPEALHNTVGLLAGQIVNQAYEQVHETERWQRLVTAGAARQRLAFTDTTARQPLPPTHYVDSLDGQATVLLLSQATLDAFTGHGHDASFQAPAPVDEQQLKDAGITLDVLATRLQHDGLRAAAASWSDLIGALTRATDDLELTG
jgi:transaldolase